MRGTSFILCLLFLCNFISCTQTPYNKRKVSNTKELNLSFTNKQGIFDEGIIYYVEDDRKSISAYKNGKLRWRVNVIDLYQSEIIGLPQVRFIKSDKKTIHVVFGKHGFADIDKMTGKINFAGSD